MVWFSYHASTKAWIIQINVLQHWNSINCMIHFALWNLSIGISRAQKRMSINLRFFAKCVYMVPSRVETTTAQTWNFMNLLFLQHVCGMVPSRDGTIFRKFEGRGHATDPGLLSCMRHIVEFKRINAPTYDLIWFRSALLAATLDATLDATLAAMLAAMLAATPR